MERAQRRKVKEPIEEPDSFGFHYPFEWLERICPYVIASGYSTFPRAGGLEDQDPLFLDDLETYTWLQEWAEQEARGLPAGAAMERGLGFDEL